MKCKLCGVEAKKIYTLSGVRASRKIGVYYCKSCSIHFCDTIEYDYKGSDQNIIQYYENSRVYIESRQNKIFSFIHDYFCKKTGVFLDVGSGIGYSLKVAQEFGWQAVGIEPSVTLESYSRNVLNLNSHNVYLSEKSISSIKKSLPEGFADYILIDNVLEHIPDPVDFFNNVLSLLKPSGVVLVVIPPVDWFRLLLTFISRVRQNSKSPQINLFYDPEQHVNYFSRKAIRLLTEKVGGCSLTNFRFHHSKLLNGWMAHLMGFETGYYFIIKNAH